MEKQELIENLKKMKAESYEPTYHWTAIKRMPHESFKLIMDECIKALGGTPNK